MLLPVLVKVIVVSSVLGAACGFLGGVLVRGLEALA